MKVSEHQIITNSCSLRAKPDYKENIISEILYGERFIEIKRHKGWVFGKSHNDNYKGWLEECDLVKMNCFTHFVISPSAIVLEKPEVKSRLIRYLSIGSCLNVVSFSNNWAKIRLYNENHYQDAYVSMFHIITKNKIIKDWVKIAESLIGTPYRWGGRSNRGIDCSGLLQISMSFAGIKIPRDTKDQYKFFKKSSNFDIKKKVSIDLLKRGNIIYWTGHVAIIKSKTKAIHSSGYHNSVLVENITKIINRIDQKPKVISFVSNSGYEENNKIR